MWENWPSTASKAFRINSGGTGLGVLGFGDDDFCVFDDRGCPPGERFRAFGGSGAIPGYRAIMVYDRPTDSVVVLLVNRSDISGVEETVHNVLRLIDRAERTN